MERKHLEREKKVLALLNHPNIVKLHKVVDDEERVRLLLFLTLLWLKTGVGVGFQRRCVLPQIMNRRQLVFVVFFGLF
jgi:serine/threonine protein kinase